MTHPIRRRLWLARAAALPATLLALPAWSRSNSWTLSIVPQFAPSKLHRDWTPVVDRIEATTGIKLNLKLAPTIPRFESEVLGGEVDFAYLNPYHQVMAHRSLGFVPLVRDGQLLSGILVVRHDDPIRALKELDGKTLAFPAPNAFGASLWMRALLTEREKLQIQAQYVQTHSNVYRQVAAGRAAAGGGIRHTLALERDEVRQELRVLFETPGAAPHPVSAHPRVPSDVRRAVAEALIALSRDAAGQALLKEVQLAAPVPADQARDYQPLERYQLERYVVGPA